MKQRARATVNLHTRGQADVLPWIIRLTMMAVAVIIIVGLVSVYTNRDAESATTHRAAMLYRIYYDDIVMYSDTSTGRVYPGIVDVNKFSTIDLDTIFAEDNSKSFSTSMKLEILQKGTCAFTVAPAIIYNHKTSFDQYYSQAKAKVTMKGSATLDEMQIPVTLRKDNIDCAGLLTIIVVRSNA